MIEALTVDELSFEVHRSARRKTLELVVDRGGELRLIAPKHLEHEVMASFVREQRFWLYSKLAEKELYLKPKPKKEFVNGEGFPYLGRSYRLLLVDEQEVPLKLDAGRFKLRRRDAGRGREHFVRWYRAHGKPWLIKRAEPWSKLLGVGVPPIDIKDLDHRWGTCTQEGEVSFHWATVLLPARMVDYVIVHELAHLLEFNHTPAFWNHVIRVLPDYAQRKDWMAKNGSEWIVF